MPDLNLFERRPDPPPAKVNALTMTVAGTLVWAVATAVVAILIGRGAVPQRYLGVCLAGLTMGALAIGWGFVHERRARRGRLAAAPAGREEPETAGNGPTAR
ncbi:DUF2530 domain-containing protein [Georgenia yuyongxinii]|uniref:DUF2530 domain-containing protein n=1 Tax=Georgenia yuyongxinii TaxID=2589797 RepID=A0A5B8BZT6_9MICO|nr:DUF2530 domain-containing protein [Georgenia yuyongxinii]QDC23728.1 DUF2530 domain-containing protein [Georgenia yuyongxinii]